MKQNETKTKTKDKHQLRTPHHTTYRKLNPTELYSVRSNEEPIIIIIM